MNGHLIPGELHRSIPAHHYGPFLLWRSLITGQVQFLEQFMNGRPPLRLLMNQSFKPAACQFPGLGALCLRHYWASVWQPSHHGWNRNAIDRTIEYCEDNIWAGQIVIGVKLWALPREAMVDCAIIKRILSPFRDRHTI